MLAGQTVTCRVKANEMHTSSADQAEDEDADNSMKGIKNGGHW